MRQTFVLALLLCACSGAATAPVDNDAPAPSAGTGIKIDAATGAISVDPSVVATVPTCAQGQVVMRTATGWACSAAASDSSMLGGKPAASYLTTDGTVANASNLGGQPAAFYLAATAKAADSAMLNGHADSFFLAAGGIAADSALFAGHPAGYFLPAAATAVNSSKLNGRPDTDFLAAGGVAVDSAKLGGQPAASYLSISGTAANASKLGGLPPSSFLPATAQAIDSAKLGGQPPSAYLGVNATAQSAITANQLGGIGATSYVRNDVGNQVIPSSLTVGDPSGNTARLILGANATSDIFGSNPGTGNLHLDSDSGGTDGRVYLNWFSGTGVAIGDGAGTVVASFDRAGNLNAASFNGMKIYKISSGLVGTGNGCEGMCNNNTSAPGKGTCISARYANSANTPANTPTSCQTVTGAASIWSFACMCSTF